MTFNKIVRLNEIQITGLQEIQNEVRSKEGYVSINQLIRDAITVFIDYCSEDAVKRYSSVYEIQMSDQENDT